MKIGFFNEDLPRTRSAFFEDLDGVRQYGYSLGGDAIEKLFREKQVR